MRIEMRDYTDEPWELMERAENELQAGDIISWYASRSETYTGTYWRVVKAGRVIDSGRFGPGPLDTAVPLWYSNSRSNVTRNQ
jgi:hypothetical protein